MTPEDDRPPTTDAPSATPDGRSPTPGAGGPAGGRERGSAPPGAPEDPPVCTYCGARFVDDELLALHRGLEHGPQLDDDERAAYADALASERDDLRLFRLQALVALLVIYFGFVLVYAFVL